MILFFVLNVKNMAALQLGLGNFALFGNFKEKIFFLFFRETCENDVIFCLECKKYGSIATWSGKFCIS